MDFEEKVRTDYYRTREFSFMNDLTAWLVEMGVPAQYAPKVASHAWSEGHAYGFREVFSHALNLLEIFE